MPRQKRFPLRIKPTSKPAFIARSNLASTTSQRRYRFIGQLSKRLIVWGKNGKWAVALQYFYKISNRDKIHQG